MKGEELREKVAEIVRQVRDEAQTVEYPDAYAYVDRILALLPTEGGPVGTTPQESAEVERLRSALDGLLTRYVELVNCGDCGHWDPEEEPEVIAARTALNTETDG